MKKLGLIAVIVTAMALWAQQGAQSENKNATEPQIGYAAQSQTQNTLIGCVGGSTDHPLLVQEKKHRTYRLLGDPAALKNEVGRMVKVSGELKPGTGVSEGAPAFQVTAVERIKESCHYLLPPGQAPTPATGKTGGEGEAFNASSSASVGRVTPGSETEAGRAQAPGPHTQLNAGGVPQPNNQTAAQGAPPNWEQAAQNPADAERIAQGAKRAELDNAQQQLGVNAKPDYSQNRNTEKHTELPGASQQPAAPAGGREKAKEAEEHEETHPTLVGCMQQGTNEHEFILREQKSGTRYRLNGSREELKLHVNHLVELVGKPTEEREASKAVAGGPRPGFDVSGVQDLAPTCGASKR